MLSHALSMLYLCFIYALSMLYLCPIHTPSVPRPCPDIPLTADTLSISRLRKKGVMIRFMLKKPVMLDVALPAASGIKAAELKNDMMPLAKNIIWLNLSSNNFTDGDLTFLSSLANLEKLRLEKNPLTDKITHSLLTLKRLEAVNLNETKITDAAAVILRKNPAIKNIYTAKSYKR